MRSLPLAALLVVSAAWPASGPGTAVLPPEGNSPPVKPTYGPSCEFVCEDDAVCSRYLREAEAGRMSATYLAAARLYQGHLERCGHLLSPEERAAYARALEQNLASARELGWEGTLGTPTIVHQEAFASFTTSADFPARALHVQIVTRAVPFAREQGSVFLIVPVELRQRAEAGMAAYLRSLGHEGRVHAVESGADSRVAADAKLRDHVRGWLEYTRSLERRDRASRLVVMDPESGAVLEVHDVPATPRPTSRPGATRAY